MLRASCSGHELVLPRDTGSGLLKRYSVEAQAKGCAAVLVAHEEVLKNLVSRSGHSSEGVTLNDYSGSTFDTEGIRWLILDNLNNIYAYPHGKFYTTLVLNKITQDNPTPTEAPFVYYEYYDHREWLLSQVENAVLIGVDIETERWAIDLPKMQAFCRARGVSDHGMHLTVMEGAKKNQPLTFIPMMDMVGYTLMLVNEQGRMHSVSFVIDVKSARDLADIRRINLSSPAKVMQNGGYDSTYFIRFACPLNNYLHDTFHMMHAWLAEMPRDLPYIGSIFMKNHMYWKDEVKTNRREYCAKDTYTTAWSYLFMQRAAPTWARENYRMEFKRLFPNMCCGLEGFLVDLKERDRLAIEYRDIRDEELTSLQNMVGQGFNPNSPKQVIKLFQALNEQKITATDKIAMRKLSDANPLNRILVDKIKAVRECGKKISTYINASLFCDRFLYEINSGGTDTARDASKASNLWVGSNVQNLDVKMRSMYIADPGYVLCASDGAQAESRTTGYISEDMMLIDAVENSPDFHSKNASLFFGIPFDELWDSELGKSLNKAIRDLSKRTNHGANYNMSAFMLLLTMGAKNVREAKRLLGLPIKMRLMQVCQFLLDSFDATYPDVRGKYYDELIVEATVTGMLKTPCDELPWVRKTFLVPSREKKDKSALNELVASKPQGLSALIIGKALFDFWYEWQIERNVVRLKCPVHDEIQYQIKENHPEHEAAGKALSELMSRSYTVRGRQLRIPCGLPNVGKRLSEVKD